MIIVKILVTFHYTTDLLTPKITHYMKWDYKIYVPITKTHQQINNYLLLSLYIVLITRVFNKDLKDL